MHAFTQKNDKANNLITKKEKCHNTHIRRKDKDKISTENKYKTMKQVQTFASLPSTIAAARQEIKKNMKVKTKRKKEKHVRTFTL